MNLSIPNPCEAKPEWLTPNANGWSCSSCQKNVYDLTHKTDAEIEALYKANHGSLCGSIPQNRLYNLPTLSFLKSWQTYAAVFVSAFSGLSLLGQTLKGEVILPPLPVSGKVLVETKQDTMRTVRVHVRHNQQFVSQAFVILKAGTQFLATGFTNEKGEFTYEVARKKLQGRMLDIHAEYDNLTGCVRSKIVKSDSIQVVDLDCVPFLGERENLVSGDITYQTHSVMMLGGMNTIYIDGKVQSKDQDHFVDTVVSEEQPVEVGVPPLMISVFPNPSIAEFTVQFNADFSGSLNVYTLTGSLVQQWKLDNQRTVLMEHQYTAGTYILVFLNKAGETVFTQKLIVL